MKKSYINPTSAAFAMLECEMIATSVSVSAEEVEDHGDIGFTKSENSSRTGQIVWDDDWSN